ncbi:hypothetical protein [Methylocella sp.]|uniref:hypothetical protein n=1 Tax=Methylocella sp. TaxID=1978226 RepID=UPI0035B4B347
MISTSPAFVFASLFSVCAAAVVLPAFAAPATPNAAPPALQAAHEAPQAAHEAPIVSGRSVASRRGSRLHHVRMKPDPLLVSAPDLADAQGAALDPQPETAK